MKETDDMPLDERSAPAPGVHIGAALRVFCFCVFIGAVSVGYLYQKNQLETLGREIRAKEKELDRLKKLNELNRDKLARMQTHRYLDMKVKQLRLGLVEPREEQILRLEEAPYASVPRESARRYVRRSAGAEVAQSLR